MNTPSSKRLFASAIAASLVLVACGGDDDTNPAAVEAAGAEPSADGSLPAGDVFISGSSTVEPISIRIGELAAQLSGGALDVVVEGPGTGDGFKKFCAGESDISDASRPIKDSEAEACAAAGIEYVELEVAIDGLSVLTNPANDAVDCLDIPSMYALLGPESEGFDSWSDAASLGAEVGGAGPFPDEPLDVFGPGEESGTYDTLVEFAIGDLAEERVGADSIFTRADYSSSGNDNFIIEGIAGSASSLGWVGYSFYAANADVLKALGVDTGDGCVVPSEETIADGTYGFSRSLYIYVNTTKAADNPALSAFVDLYLSDEGLAKVAAAGYVDVPAERIAATRSVWNG